VATAASLLESGEAAAAAHPDPEGRRRSPRDAVRDPRSAARGGRAVDAVGGGWFSYTDSRRERFPFSTPMTEQHAGAVSGSLRQG